jgi:hypothetical protein
MATVEQVERCSCKHTGRFQVVVPLELLYGLSERLVEKQTSGIASVRLLD